MLSYIAVHVSLVATQVGVEMLIYVFIYFSKTRRTLQHEKRNGRAL